MVLIFTRPIASKAMQRARFESVGMRDELIFNPPDTAGDRVPPLRKLMKVPVWR